MAVVIRSNKSLFQSLLRALGFGFLVISANAYAAPVPGTGSSLLVAPELGLFWKHQGFQLKTGDTGWQMNSSGEGENRIVRYSDPDVTGSLAVHTETLKADLTLENYTKKWMKDYPSYGFDVLGTRTFAQNGAKGLVIDLVHRKSDQQLRQVLFLKNKKAVVLTCKDEQKKFEKTLHNCNQISKSFQWGP